jgi:Sedlin, N-terminal conserved region
MRRIHDSYVGVIFNPFYVPGEKREKLKSVKFDREMERLGRDWKPTP